jgi:hypothetical protein
LSPGESDDDFLREKVESFISSGRKKLIPSWEDDDGATQWVNSIDKIDKVRVESEINV